MKSLKCSIFRGFLPLVIVAFLVSANSEDTGIRGTVSPLESVESLSVIAGGRDSLKVLPVNGVFTVAVRPGIYQLFVDAAPGYRDMRLERIVVEEGRMTDVGSLVLEKILP